MCFLEVVIPTYNRPDCMKYILEIFYRYDWFKYDIVLSIYDSSTNELTCNVVSYHKNSKINYVRFPSSMDVDEKTIKSLCLANGKYVMLCGDGIIPNIPKIINSISNSDDFEVILLYSNMLNSMNKYFINFKNYDAIYDKNTFFKYHFYQASLYGGTICKKTLIERIDIPNSISKYGNKNFIYPCILVEYSNGPYLVLNGQFLMSNKFKGSPGWITGRNALQVWIENFPKSIKLLDKYLSIDTINYIIKNNGKYTGFLTFKGLCWFKSTNNYNLKLFFHYKEELLKYSNCNKISLLFIALFPKIFLVLVRGIYHLLRRKNV